MKNKRYVLSSISYSAYRDYKKCPRLFYYRRIAKLQLPNTPLQLVFGKSLHLALELSVKEGQDPIEVFKKDFTHDKLDYLPRDKFASELAEGIRLLTFWKNNSESLLAEAGISIHNTEVPFTLTVDHDPVTNKPLNIPPIRGVIDFDLDNLPGLGDYKTSKKAYNQKMVDESDQPTFYNLWFMVKRGSVAKKFFYIVFRKGIKKKPIQILMTKRTPAQVSELLKDVEKVYRQIQRGEFDKRHKEGEFCDCKLYDALISPKYVNSKERERKSRVFPRKVVHNKSSRGSR